MSFIRRLWAGSSKSHGLMEELRMNFLCVSALSHIQFLVCLEKFKAERGDPVYFNAIRKLVEEIY